jgi:hypothetical protein
VEKCDELCADDRIHLLAIAAHLGLLVAIGAIAKMTHTLEGQTRIAAERRRDKYRDRATHTHIQRDRLAHAYTHTQTGTCTHTHTRSLSFSLSLVLPLCRGGLAYVMIHSMAKAVRGVALGRWAVLELRTLNTHTHMYSHKRRCIPHASVSSLACICLKCLRAACAADLGGTGTASDTMRA